MKLLDDLNRTQRKAVTNTEGPLLILAGAGSGKTRVITYRIAYLIKEKLIPPYAIMAVTFTNKAAEEMRNRVINLIGPTGASVFIKTFHSASVFILRRYGQHIGLLPSFSIYDQRDQEILLREILIDMKLDPKKIRPSLIASKISEIKEKAEILDGIDPLSFIPKNLPFNFAEVYEEYHRRIVTHNALDFNDLLIKNVELLRRKPEICTLLQKRWRYFMIDEYQDTNHAQYLICKYLASDSRNICVVGDDDQSIYSWRGADIRNILNFENDYKETKVITLEENYRSTEPILTVASSIIKNNNNRKEKSLKSFRGEGEPVIWCQANNEYGEAEFVINTINKLKNEALSNSDFAIFYRTNAQSRIFEDFLRRENISYRVIGGLKFYERKEIKDILSYLKFIVNPFDIVSFLRIINTPPRGIGKITLEKIRDIAYSENISEWNVIENIEKYLKKIPNGIIRFREIISSCIELKEGIPDKKKLSLFVDDVVELSGYRKSLEEENSIESKGRLENIDELLNSIYDLEIREPEATLDQFLQEISLMTSEDTPEYEGVENNNAVTLMTAHNAKGLEFPVVFLTGLEEGIFPHINSSDTPEGIEEERRLCYVGITRAMDRIFLTSAEIRRSFSGVNFKIPSRFIEEIPENLLMVMSHYESGFEHNLRPGNNLHNRYGGKADDFDSVSKPSSATGKIPAIDKTDLKIRDLVLHPKYGKGRIIHIDGSGDNTKLIINFEGGGKKVFLKKYTPLERIN